MIKFINIQQTESDWFTKAIEIYKEAFLSSERHSEEVITTRVKNGNELLFVGLENNEVVFMALLWDLIGTEFMLFDYLAAHKDFRSKGYGTDFLKFITPWVQQREKQFLLEVEDPAFGKNIEQRLKRVQFYERNGAKTLKGVNFLLPPINGSVPKEMLLMIMPSKEGLRLASKQIEKAIIQIYNEVYGRGEDDDLLKKILSDFPKEIKLV
jgi:GNAT superfamily N-acetyltransferase